LTLLLYLIIFAIEVKDFAFNRCSS